MNIFKTTTFFLILSSILFSCNNNKQSDWIYLFDGKTTNGWRGYNSDKIPPGWIASEGMLMFDRGKFELELEQDYVGGRDIIYTNEEFDEFELYFEWKIPEGGNSGIFYHVNEGYNGPHEASPEYQLIDDLNYASIHDLRAYNESFGESEPEKLQDWQKSGTNYAMHIVPKVVDKKLNPAGEWNSSKIIFTKQNVEHWLNGVNIISFVPWSDEWKKLRDSGKWNDYPDYGKFKTGYIGIQDHGSSLWFKNIKLKRIKN